MRVRREGKAAVGLPAQLRARIDLAPLRTVVTETTRLSFWTCSLPPWYLGVLGLPTQHSTSVLELEVHLPWQRHRSIAAKLGACTVRSVVQQ